MIANLPDIVALVESGWRNVRVLVVGDVMLDKYIWGEVRSHFAGSAGPGGPRYLAERATRRRSQRRYESGRTGGLRHGGGFGGGDDEQEDWSPCWPRRGLSRLD